MPGTDAPPRDFWLGLGLATLVGLLLWATAAGAYMVVT